MAEILHSEWRPNASDGALAQMGVEVEARTEEDEVAPHGPLRRRRSHGVQPLRIYRMHHVLPQGTMSSGSSDISAPALDTPYAPRASPRPHVEWF